MIVAVDLEPEPGRLRGIFLRQKDLVQRQFLNDQIALFVASYLAALLLDQVIVILLLAFIEFLETSDAALRALTPHPAKVTALKLVKHFVHTFFTQAVLIEELTAEDAETAPRVRVDPEHRDLRVLNHGGRAEVRPIAAERNDEAATFRVFSRQGPLLHDRQVFNALPEHILEEFGNLKVAVVGVDPEDS